jgi:hypothetical protein
MRSSLRFRFLKTLPGRILCLLLYIITLSWLREIIELIARNRAVRQRGEYLRDIRRGRPLRCSPRCAVIRPDVYKRADPMIYSQKYLREQGLAVTYNNPDIQLYKDGLPVSSSHLEANTKYDVVATIYNNSTEAPAVGLLVEFSFFGFGIGTGTVSIGTTIVNLPVKGATGHPVQTKTIWHTPEEEGHYCLQVNLKWADDANPRNNLGQENTTVSQASSPATFQFPVRNDDTIRKLIHMVADSYTIPQLIDCSDKPTKKDSDHKYPERNRLDVFVPLTEEEADWTLARVKHGVDVYTIPHDWEVQINPEEMVKVIIAPPEGFQGERSFNVNAMHASALVGGVTLTVSNLGT